MPQRHLILRGVRSEVGLEWATGHVGNELLKSDGTAAGTVLVKDIFPGSQSGDPQDPTYVGGTLFCRPLRASAFRANDGTNGDELWTSDGTSAGTVMVEDIRPGIGSSTSDTATPPIGESYWYLVRGRDVCGAGSYGTDSSENPRMTSACP